jgi:hypothetical protein
MIYLLLILLAVIIDSENVWGDTYNLIKKQINIVGKEISIMFG